MAQELSTDSLHVVHSSISATAKIIDIDIDNVNNHINWNARRRNLT